MKSAERLQSIQSILDVRGRVSVVELAEQFEVAHETIRRDLSKLEKDGVVRKIHGGAVTSQNKFERSFAARLVEHIPQKHELSRLAADIISPGCTLFIDFGTTTQVFVEHIKSVADLTVFTNSQLIAATLAGNVSCEVFILGGRYDDEFKANLGPMVIDNIGRFFADFAVVGIGGIDSGIGFTDQNIDEAAIARAMISRSSKSVVLADPSKFDRRGIAHVAEFKEVDYLVSSARPGKDVLAALEKNEVALVSPG